MAVGLVGVHPLVAEGGLGPVEGHCDLIGLVVAPQVDQHRGEPEDGVGDLARGGGHVGGQGEEGPVGERVPVDEHHRGHGANLGQPTPPGPTGRHTDGRGSGQGTTAPARMSPLTSRMVRRWDMAADWMNEKASCSLI